MTIRVGEPSEQEKKVWAELRKSKKPAKPLIYVPPKPKK